MCLLHIVGREAVTLRQAKQAPETTYGEWYQDRLATVILSMAARALSISFPALMRSFGIGWNLDVVTDEFKLNRTQVKQLTETIELMTVSEVLALALASGTTMFVPGPLVIVVDLVAAGDLLEFDTYLVPTHGEMSRLIGLGEVLFLQNKQYYTEPLFNLRTCTLHRSSRLVCLWAWSKLSRSTTQTHSFLMKTPGSQCRNNWRANNLAEVEDLVPS